MTAGTAADLSRRWLGVIAACTALGLACVGVANAASRADRNYSGALALFWLGLLLIFLPVAVRALRRDVGRSERLILIILVGVALYGVKILGSPFAFTFTDEYTHLRNTENILRTGHLFALNPLLRTAAYYPGLGAVTAGLVDLTGLSTFAAGLLVIGAARVLISACFFLVAEKVTRSSLAAAGASLIYAANPLFLFWSSSFSYEDLALPLAAFVVWWLGRTRHEAGRLLPVVTVGAIAAVIVTHHISAFALAGLLIAWWLADMLTRRSAAEGRSPGAGLSASRSGLGHAHRDPHTIGFMALVAGAGAVAWFHFVARPAESYLWGSNIFPALKQLGSLLTGHTALRQPYSGGGAAPPAWYVLAGFVAVALLLLALAPSLYRSWVGGLLPRRTECGFGQGRTPMIVAVAVAVAFPLTLLPRLTAGGGAISARTSEYVFTGLGCVLGLLADEGMRTRRGRSNNRAARLAEQAQKRRTMLAVVFVTAVFFGEVTVGTTFGQLLSESSDPQGFEWTVQPDVIRAAEWARTYLGINQRFGADFIDSQALVAYGEQDTVDELRVWPIFFPNKMGDTVVRTIQALKVHYILINMRMTLSRPLTPGNYYFSPYEPHNGLYHGAFPAAALRKFARSACTRMVYRSGAIRIFDVSRIEDGSCVPAAAGGRGRHAAMKVRGSP